MFGMRFFVAAMYVCLAATVSAGTPSHNSRIFDRLLSKRQSTINQSSSRLVVDLGYDQYRGVANLSTGLDTWKG